MFARRQSTFVVILMVAIALPTRSLRAQPFDREQPSPIELERPRWLPTAGDLQALLAAFDVPGLALVGLANCTVTPAITVGSATLDPATPVTGTTLFEAASLSKPVFAYLVMQLVDEGALDLDRPLAHDFAYPRIEEHENYARITPRMILAHRTGLPNWVGDTDDPDRTDRIAFVAPPGTRFSYSGEAYELLRRYVEFITDRTLDELFRERLGHIMPASTFELPPPTGAAPSRGYASSREPHSGRSLSDLGGAAGGLLTTADDARPPVAGAVRSVSRTDLLGAGLGGDGPGRRQHGHPYRRQRRVPQYCRDLPR